VRYSPKTINTSVSTDNARITSGANSLTRQHTAGSATTVTNSFGANLGTGNEGQPTGGLNFEHSEVSETHDEWMAAGTRESSQQWSESAEMTIKDWAAFASLLPTDKDATDKHSPSAITWVWAQEYPWNAMVLRPEQSGGDLQVPQDIQLRLAGTGLLQPPSDLSVMGLDFACRVSWLVTPSPAAWSATTEPTLVVTHGGTLWQANHSLVTPSADEEKPKADDKTAQVVIKPTPTPALTGTDLIHQIHLEQLSLAPILDAGMANGAIVTFVAGEFRQQDAAGFAITSRAGNLFAQGKGLVLDTDANTFTVNLAGPTPGSIALYFKILDIDLEYDLVFKHWITGGVPAVLAAQVNDHPPIKQYVTEREGEGGDSNVTSIALRTLTFGAVDYHDYLQVGMNKIAISVQANQTGAGNYNLRAMAIG
jgi:hypothetical protein